jgi:hypothetical protein
VAGSEEAINRSNLAPARSWHTLHSQRFTADVFFVWSNTGEEVLLFPSKDSSCLRTVKVSNIRREICTAVSSLIAHKHEIKGLKPCQAPLRAKEIQWKLSYMNKGG